jgi:hypothetical protein
MNRLGLLYLLLLAVWGFLLRDPAHFPLGLPGFFCFTLALAFASVVLCIACCVLEYRYWRDLPLEQSLAPEDLDRFRADGLIDSRPPAAEQP